MISLLRRPPASRHKAALGWLLATGHYENAFDRLDGEFMLALAG